MFGSWYTQPIVDRVHKDIDSSTFDRELHQIQDLERMLTRDGNIIVKLWFHLTAKEQDKRRKQDSKKISISRRKASPLLEEYAANYKRFANASQRAIQLTDTGAAPWHIIEATDGRYRDITAGQLIATTLETRLSESSTNRTEDLRDVTLGNGDENRTVLDTIDLTEAISEEDYDREPESLQHQLHTLTWELHEQKHNAVMVVEGWDAAGKGSAIRRVTQAMDARLYRVIPIAAPTDEELYHHYLWRFWRRVPRAGYVTIYDRSWYGRVLVERVEGFADRREWLRSYQEINDFEEQLAAHGASVLKFWLHISPEEQLARFEARQQDPRKQHKITDEDWRNREKWTDYKLAVNDMVAHTSTAKAPWTLIPGNDKKLARIKILKTICERLADNLGSK